MLKKAIKTKDLKKNKKHKIKNKEGKGEYSSITSLTI